MMAMTYETLLRIIYQCGRNASIGADADHYRKLEREYFALNNSNIPGSASEKEYEYQKAFAAVRSYVWQALRAGADKIHYNLSPEENEEIDRFISELSSIRFYDKERLDVIIEAAIELTEKGGLKML